MWQRHSEQLLLKTADVCLWKEDYGGLGEEQPILECGCIVNGQPAMAASMIMTGPEVHMCVCT